MFSLCVALFVGSIYFIFRRCLQIAELRMYCFWWAHSLYFPWIFHETNKCENWYFRPFTRTRNIKRTRQLQCIAATAERSFIFIFVRALDARFVTELAPACVCMRRLYGVEGNSNRNYTLLRYVRCYYFSLFAAHTVFTISVYHILDTFAHWMVCNSRCEIRFPPFCLQDSWTARAQVCVSVTHAQSLECLSYRPQIAIQ